MPRAKNRSTHAKKSIRTSRVARVALRPPRIAGTLTIIGDLDKSSQLYSEELEMSALRRAKRVGLIDD